MFRLGEMVRVIVIVSVGTIKVVLVVKHVGLAETALRIPVIMGSCPMNPLVAIVNMTKDVINMVMITALAIRGLVLPLLTTLSGKEGNRGRDP